MAAKTWERDSVVYRKPIRPVLGGRVLAELNVEDLVVWQERLEEEDVGDPTLIKGPVVVERVRRELLEGSLRVGPHRIVGPPGRPPGQPDGDDRRPA